MREYNWRKEREKYLPEFMKNESGNSGEQPPAPPVKRSSRGWIAAAAAIVAVVLIAVIAVVVVRARRPQKHTGDPSTMLAQAAERHKSAVGLVVLTVEGMNGNKVQCPIGTAWAFAPDKFATNAHVAHGLPQMFKKVKMDLATEFAMNIAKQNGFNDLEAYLKSLGNDRGKFEAYCIREAERRIRGAEASIIINGSGRKSYPVKAVRIHRDYGVVDSKFDPDVAVLTIDGKHDVHFKIADESTLAALKSGEPIAFLGFPMENLSDKNVNIDNPIASMQSGIVVAVSDFDMKDAGAKVNYLIRHNLPLAGGASGSPIFNSRGEVVALLYAGNMIGQVRNGKVQRAPSAAQINFGVRSDLLKGVGEPIDIKEFLKR